MHGILLTVLSGTAVVGDGVIDMVQLVQDAVKDSNISAKMSGQSQLSAAEKQRVLQFSHYDVDDDEDNNLYPFYTVLVAFIKSFLHLLNMYCCICVCSIRENVFRHSKIVECSIRRVQ